MVTKEQLRNHWFFKKYEINDDMPMVEKVWRYQWNNKALIMIECGIVYLLCYYVKQII